MSETRLELAAYDLRTFYEGQGCNMDVRTGKCFSHSRCIAGMRVAAVWKAAQSAKRADKGAT